MKERKLTHNKYFLALIIFVNSLIMLFNALFAPSRMIGLISAMVGIFTFYMIFLVPVKNTLIHDVLLAFATLVQGLLSSLLLLGICQFITNLVCVSEVYKMQVIVNFAYPFLTILFLWFTQRIPVFFKRRSMNK